MSQLLGKLLYRGPVGMAYNYVWPPNAPTEQGDFRFPMEPALVRLYTTVTAKTKEEPLVHMKDTLFTKLNNEINACWRFLFFSKMRGLNADIGIVKSNNFAYSVILQEKTTFWGNEVPKPYTGDIYTSTLGYIFVTKHGDKKAKEYDYYINFKRKMDMGTELYPPHPVPHFSEFRFQLTKYNFPYYYGCIRSVLLKIFTPPEHLGTGVEKVAEIKGLPRDVEALLKGFVVGERPPPDPKSPLNKLAAGENGWTPNPRKSNKPGIIGITGTRNRRANNNNNNMNNGRHGGGGSKTRKRRHS